MTQFLTKQQVMDGFNYRKSCRYYDETRKISAEDFNFILDLGRLSPSSVGSEPWRFLVIQNKALREKLKPVAWGMATQLDSASHLVFFLAKKNARFDSEFLRASLIRRGIDSPEGIAQAQAKYESFQKNDMKTLESERSLFDWCSKQTYIAMANMMTGAAMIGIDSCPIEGFNYDAVNKILADEGLFDPTEWGVSVATTFGYRTRDLTRKGRQSMEDVVKWVG